MYKFHNFMQFEATAAKKAYSLDPFASLWQQMFKTSPKYSVILCLTFLVVLWLYQWEEMKVHIAMSCNWWPCTIIYYRAILRLHDYTIIVLSCVGVSFTNCQGNCIDLQLWVIFLHNFLYRYLQSMGSLKGHIKCI